MPLILNLYFLLFARLLAMYRPASSYNCALVSGFLCVRFVTSALTVAASFSYLMKPAINGSIISPSMPISPKSYDPSNWALACARFSGLTITSSSSFAFFILNAKFFFTTQEDFLRITLCSEAHYQCWFITVSKHSEVEVMMPSV